MRVIRWEMQPVHDYEIRTAAYEIQQISLSSRRVESREILIIIRWIERLRNVKIVS